MAADLHIASHQFHSGPCQYELIFDSAIVLPFWMCLAHVTTRMHLSSIQSTARLFCCVYCKITVSRHTKIYIWLIYITLLWNTL